MSPQYVWVRYFAKLCRPASSVNTTVRAGVCFYNRESLPGYSAIFRHANDELNYCYYLIPCGKDGMCGDVTVRASLLGKI